MDLDDFKDLFDEAQKQSKDGKVTGSKNQWTKTKINIVKSNDNSPKAKLSAEGQSNDNKVKIKINGNKKFQSINIDSSLLSLMNKNKLEKNIIEAADDAVEKINNAVIAKLKKSGLDGIL